MPERVNDWRTGPMYTITEAARLAHVSTGTVRNWLQGYQTAIGTNRPPVFGGAQESAMVSFLQLVEIVMASRFRRRGVSLDRVRSAYINAREEYRVDYPFAHLELKAWAGHILHVIQDRPEESLHAIDTPGLHTLPGLVQEAIEALDYEDDLAARWYPLGKGVAIVVDPRYGSGLPTIRHRGVTVGHIKSRFDAGQSIGLISKDLTLPRSQVEEAIRYADKIAA